MRSPHTKNLSTRLSSSLSGVALCLAALLTGAALAADMGTTVSAPTVAERLSLAREAIKVSDFKKAQSELRLAAREAPRNADVHNLLGYSLRKQATPDLPKAFEQYTIALKLNPNHRGAHEYIGEAYLVDKNPAKAEEHLAQLQSICGNTSCEEYQDLAKSIADYKAKNQ